MQALGIGRFRAKDGAIRGSHFADLNEVVNSRQLEEAPLEVPVQARRVRFGAFEVNLRSGELRKHGLKIKLQDQPFQILALLLERPGEVVTREELRHKLWPADTFVDFDVGLNTAIKRLRDALGDTAESPRYVETLPRRGYRFIAPVEEAAVEPAPAAPVAPPAPVTEEPTAMPMREPEAAAPAKQGRRPNLWIVAGAVVTVVVLLVSLNIGGWRQRVFGRAGAARIQSIAVLPLENLTGDPSQDYFVDGMTDVLITDLAQISALRVISRTSVMHYKGTKKTLPEIARELNVDAVVEGTAVRSGDRVRITAQLIHAATDRHLWARNYERDLRDVLALQDEVARDITNQVQIKLAPQSQVRLASAHAVDPEALEAYLKGRYEWNKWTEEGVKKSIEYFERAIQKDPNYAQAWAGLSDAYLLLGLDFDSWPPQVVLPKAKAAALKALELDETLSDAHVSLGGIMMHREWSWSAAEKESQRAIALNPNNATAHQWYGFYLIAMGRFDEAVAEMKRAQELDPLSPNKQQSLGRALYLAGRYDEALEQFREVPDNPDLRSERRHRWMAAIYERKGMQKEAVAELRTSLSLGGKKDLVPIVEQKYLSSGYPGAKKTFLWGDIKELERRAKAGRLSSYSLQIAADYALLGEKSEAFEWLEKGFQERGVHLMYLKADDSFEALRSDPRFEDLLRRMALPP